MKRGEKIVIERAPAGVYAITLPDGSVSICGAASAALVLNSAVFQTEAAEYVDEKGRIIAGV